MLNMPPPAPSPTARPRTTSTRSRVAGGAAVLALATLLGSAALPASLNLPTAAAAENPSGNRVLTIDSDAAGPEISPTQYGIFYEDINQAADGGLYAELIRNRSFEFSRVDHSSFNSMTAWDIAQRGGSEGTATVVDDAQRLNEMNRNYLSLNLTKTAVNGGTAIRNTGFSGGQAYEAGKSYNYSVFARTTAPEGTPLSVNLENAAGDVLGTTAVTVKGDGWAKYTAQVTATASTTSGRLTTIATGTGELKLDMISLFPQDTFMGRENGLRQDLAQKVADLDPGFLRFPGGCVTNTGGTYGAYTEANGFPRDRVYQWKETIGPVESRPANKNFWGYNQTYGLGYMEYFEYAEDMKSEPLPVVSVGLTACGQENYASDADVDRYVQDTLDLIEFANGGIDTVWGAKRAELGHPEPFNLKYIGLGNEEGYAKYFENFPKFRDAITAKHPEIKIIGTSGAISSGQWFDDLWDYSREQKMDMVDEHYYNDPEWFLRNTTRYDSYDRNDPKVFLGEYASKGNGVNNALAEAAYMTGLERNADVVQMASYAPLLAAEGHTQWTPDMIFFDNGKSWTTPNYDVQKLFMNNVGNSVVPSKITAAPVVQTPMTGKVGLSTWLTSAAYDDVSVTAADGTVLMTDDFSNGTDQWTGNGNGNWAVADGAYVQGSTTTENTMITAGDSSWNNYTFETKATKLAGAEGFLVGFGVEGNDDYYWWNLGGFNNTRSLVEKATGGTKTNVLEKNTRIVTGQSYDIKVEVTGRTANLYLDGELWGTINEEAVDPVYQVVTQDDATGDTVVKVVNAAPYSAKVDVKVGGGLKVAAEASVTTLVGTSPTNMNQSETVFAAASNAFTYQFEPSSVTFLRLKSATDVPEPTETPAPSESPDPTTSPEPSDVGSTPAPTPSAGGTPPGAGTPAGTKTAASSSAGDNSRDDNLAQTGTTAAALAWLAGGLALAGLGIVVIGRRRASRHQ
ncbi:alpha-L-arabinofuranosidase C-terminal domain-containing protein [Specibacter sp. NPDC078692]|uniref:alpha-L-arabinofuranosidase C-terminal domain-containing protein n=1 Tax=Specibacter sp. NPDC078692 TaxID=3155818 RepID=UPI0034429C58